MTQKKVRLDVFETASVIEKAARNRIAMYVMNDITDAIQTVAGKFYRIKNV